MSSHKSATKLCLPKPGIRRRRVKRSGFTLIEMLIVLVIIGILASILFPVFARVRENGRRTACTSNMKQLGLAFQQYVQDNNNKLPIALDGGYGQSKTSGWTYYTQKGTTDSSQSDVKPAFDPTKGSLYPYVRSEAAYICPSDDEGKTSKQTYAVNACAFLRDNPTNEPDGGQAGSVRKGKSMVRFRSPSEWMLLGEEARYEAKSEGSSTDDAYLNLRTVATQDPIYQNFFSSRHSAGSVITFLDGHAKWYTVDQILTNRFQIGGPHSMGALADGCQPGVN